MGHRVLLVDDRKLAPMAEAEALNAFRPGGTRVEADDFATDAASAL